MRSRNVYAPWWLLAWLCACAAGQQPHASSATAPEPLSYGEPMGQPTLASLPSMPGGDMVTLRTRQGLLVAREAFDQGLPQSPEDRSYQSLQTWVDADVVQWLGARNERLEQARFEFGLGRDATPAERIVAFAATGLLQEDTARQLATIPAPAELDREPMVQEIYQDVIRAQARPFLSSALVGYRQCADLAHDGPEPMRHWAAYCDARFQRLKAEVQADQQRIAGQAQSAAVSQAPAPGTTTVEVVEE